MLEHDHENIRLNRRREHCLRLWRYRGQGLQRILQGEGRRGRSKNGVGCDAVANTRKRRRSRINYQRGGKLSHPSAIIMRLFAFQFSSPSRLNHKAIPRKKSKEIAIRITHQVVRR